MRMRSGFLALFGMVACAGDLPEASLITYPRVLGVRAEALDAPDRATLESGEHVRVRVLIVGPEPLSSVAFAATVCPGSEDAGRLPACSGPVFFDTSGKLDGPLSEIEFEFDVPDTEGLDGASRLRIAGTTCTEGEPKIDGAGFGRCRGADDPGVQWSGHLELEADEVNHHPRLTEDALRLDGDRWALGEDCQDLPAWSAEGDTHAIEVNLEEAEREDEEGRPEELLVSHYVTGGELSSRFSVLERAMADDTPLVVDFVPPEPGSREQPLTVAVVLRDRRGGVDWTLRTLCPP